MDFDRQAIERRDFPIGRRGYDPAAVDAHLRSLAAEFEQLQKSDASLGSAAGSQVQSILEAAETAAGEIERAALESARQVREAADNDAERTREDAIEKAKAHVAAVAQVTAVLLERVNSMDSEVNGLIESLRAGAGRLAADLGAVETGMGELYGAASGQSHETAQARPAALPPTAVAPPASAPAPAQGVFEAELGAAIAAGGEGPTVSGKLHEEGVSATDTDGARLIALNMALNGESRSDTERYLAENFELPDRLALIDEVYAAIEG